MTEKEKEKNRERQRRFKAKKREDAEKKRVEKLGIPDEQLSLRDAVKLDEISGRTRTWLFLVYPTKEMCEKFGLSYDGRDGYGSCPDNWREILDSFHVPWVESPLHDADINGDGTEKKPHWHIMLLFDSVKSYEQVSIFSSVVNGSFPIKCRSMRGSVRYFLHLDNPDKAQYKRADMHGHCGADVDKLLELSTSEKSVLLNQILDFIVEDDIVEYADILDYSRLWRPDWYDLIVSSYTLVLRTYLQSRRNKDTHQRYFLDRNGQIVDNLSLSYADRISSLQAEISRLQEEEKETKQRSDAAQKHLAAVKSLEKENADTSHSTDTL